MFKSWRNDKKKIKAVFKLQFQAIQLPRLKKPSLIISLVPEDVGKTTFKLEKAAVQDGTCSWENPVFVAVKLVKEQKSGKLHEKIYHFIVSSGSSKSGYLGECSIDFSDFAEETEPVTVSLPLKFANSGAILHVTIQKVQGGLESRHIHDGTDPTLAQDGSLKSQLSNNHTDGNRSCAEEEILDILSISDEEQEGVNNASFSSNTTSPTILRQNSMSLDGVDENITKKRLHRRSSTDWSLGSASDGSLVDSTKSPEDNFPRVPQETSDESIERLKGEISNLMRQSEISELELQSLRKQIIKESKRAQDLSRQLIGLTEERDALKTECIQLKSLKKSVDDALNQLIVQNEDSRVQLEETGKELNHEKELNANLKVQIQKIQDSNSELILAVKDLDEMLEKKNMDIASISSELELSKTVSRLPDTKSNSNMEKVEDQGALPEWGDLDQEKDDTSELHQLKQNNAELSAEIEVYKQDREKIENFVEQLTQDYEDLRRENLELSSMLEQNRLEEVRAQDESSNSLATIKDLESQIQRFEEKLKKQTQEFSESLLSVNDLECRVKGLEKELEKQAQDFENDLDEMMNAKIEQEQRAIRAEEALRKTRWKNAITAERLQEEIKTLSTEMASKFNENEKLTSKALTESNELREQKRKLEESLKKTNEQFSLLEEQNRIKVEELSAQLDLKTKDVEKMTSELECMAKQLKCAQKHNEETEENFSAEIQMLKTKLETLTKEKNGFIKQGEQKAKLGSGTAQMAIAVDNSKTIDGWKAERTELEERLAFAKKEEEKAQKELDVLRSLKEDKENMVEKLLSDVEILRAQNVTLTHSLSKEESEKEELRKLVCRLEESAQAVKKGNGQNAPSLGNPESKSDDEEVEIGRKSSKKELKISKDDSNLTKLSTELAMLQERNKSMERELKEMQERYSEISLKFAEVEGERQQLVMTVRNLKNKKS